MSYEVAVHHKKEQPGLKERLKSAVTNILTGLRFAFTEKYTNIPHELELKIVLRTLALLPPTLAFAACLSFAQDSNPNITQAIKSDSQVATNAPLEKDIRESKAIAQPKPEVDVAWQTETISVEKVDRSSPTITNTVEITELRESYSELAITSRTHLYLDKKGDPVAINIDSPNDPTVRYTRYLTDQEREEFKLARMVAQDIQEPWMVDLQILDPFTVETLWDQVSENNINQPTEIRGVMMPTSVEVLTEEALAAFGVTVHSAKNLPTQLHILPAAFRENGFLQPLLELNTIAGEEPKHTLKIFLVDSTFLHSTQLTEEQKSQLAPEELARLDRLQEQVYQAVSNFRDYRKQLYDDEIATIRRHLHQLKETAVSITLTQAEVDGLHTFIAEESSRILRVRRDRELFESFTYAELYYYFYDDIKELDKQSNFVGAIGQFITGPGYRESNIFITAGEATITNSNVTQFWYLPSGQVQGQLSNTMDLVSSSREPDYLPQWSKSYPDPKDLFYNHHARRDRGLNGEYHLLYDTFIQILQHEIMHFNLTIALPEIAAFDRKNGTQHIEKLRWFIDLLKFIPGKPEDFTVYNSNEFDTDRQTLHLLSLAYEKLIVDADVSLYQFLFTTPANKHDKFNRFMIAEHLDTITDFANALVAYQRSKNNNLPQSPTV